jgi:4-amino-4-deoxy-L-arabinose transferase-like glycosyltransferase
VRDWVYSHWVVACLTLILISGACLRIVSFIGYGYQGDDVVYAYLAHEMATGQFLQAAKADPLIYPLRVGILAPAAASFRLFGVSEQALGVYPLLVSLLGIVLAYIAGRAFFGERAGVLAALLQAFLPVDLRYGTLLYPDPPGALWLNVAILLAYLGSREPLTRRKSVYGALAGLFLGLSWLSKEAVLFSLPFLAGYLLWTLYHDKRTVALVAAVTVGCAITLGLEATAYARYFGDPLYHLHAIERHSHHPLATPWFWSPDASWAQLGARLFRDGPETILLSTRFGLVTAVASLGICYALFKGRRSYAFVGTWFVYHALMFNFGSHSLRNYMPLPTYDRYLWPLLLPAILLTAAFVADLLHIRRGAVPWREADSVFWAGTLSIVLLLGFAHGTYRNFKEDSAFRAEKSLSRMLPSDAVIFADGLTLSGLRFFWAYPQHTRLVEFGGMRTSDIARAAYVVVNPKWAEIMVQQGWKPPEFFYRSVPEMWVEKWKSPRARLYWVPD